MHRYYICWYLIAFAFDENNRHVGRAERLYLATIHRNRLFDNEKLSMTYIRRIQEEFQISDTSMVGYNDHQWQSICTPTVPPRGIRD